MKTFAFLSTLLVLLFASTGGAQTPYPTPVQFDCHVYRNGMEIAWQPVSLTKYTDSAQITHPDGLDITIVASEGGGVTVTLKDRQSEFKSRFENDQSFETQVTSKIGSLRLFCGLTEAYFYELRLREWKREHRTCNKR